MASFQAAMVGFEGCELKEEKGEWAIEGAIDELNDSERFISGGDSSEETVRRWLGGVLYGRSAIVQCEGWRVFVGGVNGGRAQLLKYPLGSNGNDWAFGANTVTNDCELGVVGRRWRAPRVIWPALSEVTT